jgi:hypothetical protein
MDFKKFARIFSHSHGDNPPMSYAVQEAGSSGKQEYEEL